MAGIKKCNSSNCSKRFICDRHIHPSTPEEAMQKYEKFHPEAPWLCFWKQEVEPEKETPDIHEPHSDPYEATISKERREAGDW